MSYKSIFKMEMFKFYKESAFFLAFVILAIVNIICSLFAFLAGSSSPEGFLNIVFLILVSMLPFSILATFVMLGVYPIHSFSTDYKNNVMATIISSGVDRVKLYFTKFIAICINSAIMTFFTIIVPIILIGLAATITYEISVFSYVQKLFNEMMSEPLVMLMLIISSFASLAGLVFATIQLKGSYLAILVFFAYSMGISIIRSLVMLPFQNTSTALLVVNILFQILTIAMFVFLSVKTLKNQDL